ncbi:MAG: sigma-54 dependent transcriptional regulator [Pseudomonadota bacterium]
MTKGCVLVVDDDREMRASLSHLLVQGGFAVQLAKGGGEALSMLLTVSPDVVLSDVRMPGMDGIAFQKRAAEVSDVPFVLFSAHGDIPMAVKAIQDGAYNFIEKPFDPRRLLTLLSNAIRLKQAQQKTAHLERQLASLTDLEQILIGESESLKAARRDILDFADSPANVLIHGATGTGKELVAKALHDLGQGPAAPFIAVNCADIPPEQFEKTVYGFRGSPGLMQTAEGGTLFLDELTSMPNETQAKLLRVIEERRVQPVGSSGPLSFKFRLISAMSKSPEIAVADGALRQDLLFRLNTLMIELPLLAERGEDILLIFRHYVRRLSTLYDVAEPKFHPADFSVLLTYEWPGNVRELQNVAERFVLSAKRGSPSVEAVIGADETDVPKTLREAVAAFERQLISDAIVSHKGRMDDAADALGIGRRTLNEKVVKLGIDKDDLLSD